MAASIPLVPAPPLKIATAAPTQKVIAGSAGGSLAGSVALIVLFLLSKYAAFDPPTDVQIAIVLVVGHVVGFLAAYFTPPAQRDVPVPK